MKPFGPGRPVSPGFPSSPGLPRAPEGPTSPLIPKTHTYVDDAILVRTLYSHLYTIWFDFYPNRSKAMLAAVGRIVAKC